MNKLFISIVVFLSISVSSGVYATNVTMSGNIAYQISGGQVTFWVEKISNNSFFTNSGTLKLKLWATGEPYSGGYTGGYIIGTYNIGMIQAGYYLNGLKTTAEYIPPPAGSYFVTLTLTEWNGSNDVVVDYKNFSSGLNIEDTGGDGGGCFISVSAF